MNERSTNKHLIAKNTTFLYLRMIFAMGVSLYTSRIVLAELGVSDFGIYSVVGGVVTLFTFVNSAMASSTQRYLTFAIGRGDKDSLKLTFNTALQIHILISIIVVIITELIGIWFLNHKMQIPADRINAAWWVFQFSVLSMIVNFLNVPYMAIIIAYERMGVFAYISIIEVLFKLGIAYLLIISPIDRLVFYAVLMFICPLVIRVIYTIYCYRNFNETRIVRMYDKGLFREMATFAGWSMFGQVAGILSTQGLNVLLNVFFGPIVNAARGIAVQIQSAVTQFSYNFQTAVNPQITKNFATNDFKDLHNLIFQSSKFTFFLLYTLSLPLIIETPFVLNLWLKDVPSYTTQFFRIIIFISIIDAMANPFMVAASATGNIKKYQAVVGGMLLLILPLSYIVLKFGAPPESVFIINLIICIIAFYVRLHIVKNLIELSSSEYIRKVVVVCILSCLLSSIFPIFLKLSLADSTINSIIIMIASFICVCLTAYYVGMTKSERDFSFKIIHRFIRRHD